MTWTTIVGTWRGMVVVVVVVAITIVLGAKKVGKPGPGTGDGTEKALAREGAPRAFWTRERESSLGFYGPQFPPPPP